MINPHSYYVVVLATVLTSNHKHTTITSVSWPIVLRIGLRYGWVSRTSQEYTYVT